MTKQTRMSELPHLPRRLNQLFLQALWLLAIALANWSAPKAQEVMEQFLFPSQKISHLKVHNSTGDVNIAPATGKTTLVVANKKRWGPRCKLDINEKNGVLSVIVDDRSWILDHECRVDLILSVPEKVVMQLRAGTGNVQIAGTRGDIDVKVGSGALSIKADMSRLKALSGSGNIEMNGLVQEAEMVTGSGDIQLTLLQTPKKGLFNVRAGSGDLNIYVPKEMALRTRTETGNGQVINEFESDNQAQVEILARSGSGDIQIRGR